MKGVLRLLFVLCVGAFAAPSYGGDFGAPFGGEFGAGLPGGAFGQEAFDRDSGPSNLPQPGAPTRIKNIVALQGVRPNQLVGYGLVIGLNATGDSLRNSPFTEQSLQAMLDRMGVNIRRQTTRTRNS